MKRWDPFLRVTEVGGRDAVGLCPGATGREEGSLITHTLSRGQLPKLCPRALEPRLPGCPTAWRSRHPSRSSLEEGGRAYEAVPRRPSWGHFWRIWHRGALGWPGFFGGLAFRSHSLSEAEPQRLGRRQRSKTEVSLPLTKLEGLPRIPAQGQHVPEFPGDKGILHPSPCHSGLHVLIVGDQKQPALVKESSTPGVIYWVSQKVCSGFS